MGAWRCGHPGSSAVARRQARRRHRVQFRKRPAGRDARSNARSCGACRCLAPKRGIHAARRATENRCMTRRSHAMLAAALWLGGRRLRWRRWPQRPTPVPAAAGALHVYLAARRREPQAARRHHARRAGDARQRAVGRLAGAAAAGLERARARPPGDRGDGGHLSRHLRLPRGGRLRRRPAGNALSVLGHREGVRRSGPAWLREPGAHPGDAVRRQGRRGERADDHQALAAGLDLRARGDRRVQGPRSLAASPRCPTPSVAARGCKPSTRSTSRRVTRAPGAGSTRRASRRG